MLAIRILSVIVNYNTSSPSTGRTPGAAAMKAAFEKYLNEIVGLTVMALMTVALIAGQANAEFRKSASPEAPGIIEIQLTIKD